MHVDLTPDQRTLQQTLRTYFSELMTPKRRASLQAMNMEGGRIFRETVKQMGRDGWLGVGWPKEYGGGGLTAIEQLIFFEELRRAHAPLPFVTLNTVGPALMTHGSEEHKQEFLTRILAGEVHFAIGYTEPDLALFSNSRRCCFRRKKRRARSATKELVRTSRLCGHGSERPGLIGVPRCPCPHNIVPGAMMCSASGDEKYRHRFTLDLVVADYEQHLLGVAGLTSETCRAWTFYVRGFLTAQFKVNRRAWIGVGVMGRLLEYLEQSHEKYSLTRLQCLASALRSTVVFCVWLAIYQTDLSAIPQVASQGRADLPSFRSHPELEKLLAASKGRSVARQRNHAIVLCIARLRVPSGEMAG